MTFADAFAAHEHDEEQDRPTADQTPATDSERVERLHEALDLVQEARVSGFTQIDSDTVFAIDDEVTRLTALLAEQAATIERVQAVHSPERRTISVPVFDRFDSPTQVINGCTCGSRTYPCPTARALGSQRTEGQG